MSKRVKFYQLLIWPVEPVPVSCSGRRSAPWIDLVAEGIDLLDAVRSLPPAARQAIMEER